MRRNLTRQVGLQPGGFYHRFIMKQRKTVLWILFVSFTAAYVCTALRPLMGSKSRKFGTEFTEKDSLHMEFIQSIIGNGKRKS